MVASIISTSSQWVLRMSSAADLDIPAGTMTTGVESGNVITHVRALARFRVDTIRRSIRLVIAVEPSVIGVRSDAIALAASCDTVGAAPSGAGSDTMPTP